MNIFYLDNDPVWAARYHVDKHVVKMIQEYAQLMSTAHRVLDGAWKKQVLLPSVYRNLCTLGWTGKVDHLARLLPGEGIAFEADEHSIPLGGWTIINKKAMMMTHHNHPSAIWARESVQNYMWLYSLFKALCDEKAYRYPKGPNNTLKLYGEFLSKPPINLVSTDFSEPPLAMPARYKVEGDAVASYRRYYIGDKFHFARWTGRSIPRWYLQGIADVWSDNPDDRAIVLSDPRIAKRTDITTQHIKKYLPDVYNRLVV